VFDFCSLVPVQVIAWKDDRLRNDLLAF